MKKILINASNLHVGGGVQVATSFISNLLVMEDSLREYDVTVYVSSMVLSNIEELPEFNKSALKLILLNVRGVESLRPSITRKFLGFDLVFTLFGPFYLFPKVSNCIVGFAQAWITNPKNEVYYRKSFFDRNIDWIKYEIQWLFFRKSDWLVVEAKSIKGSLVSMRGYEGEKIHVIPNCLSQVFLRDADANTDKAPFLFERQSEVIYLGIVSRDYKHKNLDYLADVCSILNEKGECTYKFVVTLTEGEWRKKTPHFKNNVINAGVVDYNDLPRFYSRLDGVVFPSLLESFSVTPMEALASRKPLFASNRDFVKDVCGMFAHYFDPLVPDSSADTILNWFENTDSSAQKEWVSRAYDFISIQPNSLDRTNAYIELIKDVLTNNLDSK